MNLKIKIKKSYLLVCIEYFSKLGYNYIFKKDTKTVFKYINLFINKYGMLDNILCDNDAESKNKFFN